MFAADAAAAAASGWAPIAQAWDGATLIVTYGPAVAAMAPPPARKRRNPWPWIVGIFVGLLVVGALVNGAKERVGPAGVPTTPRPRATPSTMTLVGSPTVTTRTSVGDAITITFRVKNTGTVPGEFVIGIAELSRHALFVGCAPECEDLGESFTGQRMRLPGPRPGNTASYTITWQATSAARAEWSMWMSVGDDEVDSDDPGWEATTVILL